MTAPPPISSSSPSRTGEHELPYLPSLDGLRAVAITLVLVYHLRPSVLPGGFVGVDLFFVISGFLICAPIVRAIELGASVGAGSFLFRRARRLLPAMFVVVAVTCIVIGQLVSTDLHRLARHASSSLTYTMNWTLASERHSYTDLIEGASPLRHMWSLAVEEQFYLAVAGLLVAWSFARRRSAGGPSRRTIAAVSLALAAGSAIAMWAATPNAQQNARAYYGTDTRAQTLLLGVAAAALIDPRVTARGRRVASVTTWAGLCVVAFVAAEMNEQSTLLYHGGFLVVALAGTALVAGALRDRWLRTLLGRPLLVRVGRLSYSLYLWHWPVIIFVRRQWPDARALPSDLAILAATLALASVTYAAIEQPCRRRLGRDISVRTSVATLAVASLAAFGLITVTTRTDSVRPTAAAAAAPSPPVTVATVEVPTTVAASMSTHSSRSLVAEHRRVVIVGDSMAHTLAGGQVADFPDFTPWTPEQSSFIGTSVDAVSIARPACSFLAGDVAYTEPDGTWYSAPLASYCGAWRDDLADLVTSTPPVDAVLVALSNDLEDRAVDGRLVPFGSPEYIGLLDDFLDSVQTALPPRTRLVLVAGPPRDPAPQTDPGGWREIEMRSILRDEAASRADTVVIDLGELVCPGDDCDAPADGFAPNDRFDGLHFTPDGAHRAAAWLADQLIALP